MTEPVMMLASQNDAPQSGLGDRANDLLGIEVGRVENRPLGTVQKLV